MKQILFERYLPLLLLVVAGVANAESLSVRLVDPQGEVGLENAVIEVVPLENGPALPLTPRQGVIDQVDKEFTPSVTVVPKGSRLSFPNSDDILHHVYSFSSAKTFDIPLYGADENRERLEAFDTPGVVEIGCNIHDWMLAYVYVAESDMSALTSEDGRAVIEGLSPGSYQVRIWHPRMGEGEVLVQELSVTAGSGAELSVSVELGRERRIRRAPSATRGSYR